MKFNGLILDIDGTIWNTTGVVADAWNRAVRKCGFTMTEITAETLKHEFGKTMNDIADDLFSSVKEEDRVRLLESCCREEQLAVRECSENITYPDVRETIADISSHMPVFIVSNCQKGYIELVMEKNGIAGCISDYECYGNTGKGKSENIKDIVKRNSITHPVYAGDTQGDCDACRDAGVPFIWASYGFGTADTYYAAIRSFSEIKEYL
jgi:phosphoglycolate phosphatase